MYQSAMASRIKVPDGDPLGAQEALNHVKMPLPGEYDVDVSPQNAANHLNYKPTERQEPPKPESDTIPSL